MTNEQVAATIDQLIRTALERGGNAVHIEPGERRVTVRLRLDGKLQLMAKLPRHLEPAITEHITSLTDTWDATGVGHHTLENGQHVRINRVPTANGTHHVLHVSMHDAPHSLDSLGFNQEQLQAIEHMLSQPHGIVLTAHPDQRHADMLASSLAALLHGVGRTVEDARDTNTARHDVNIIDRNRYETRIERLRHALHSKHSVIIADSLIDQATSEFALEAALGGRFIITSVSASSSAQALRRLLDLQLAPHVVAATLRGVIFQRTVRTLCTACRESYIPSKAALQRFQKQNGLAGTLPVEQLWRASKLGCAYCHHSGYRGTTGIVEVLQPSAALHSAVLANAPIATLAHAASVTPAAHDGFVKVKNGQTSLEEISATRYR